MRTSGRGGSETLMFLGPAVIFGAFFLWLTGDPMDFVRWVDRNLMHLGYMAWTWSVAVIQHLLQ